jgi:O-antigen/teichoic acid export membrane protein
LAGLVALHLLAIKTLNAVTMVLILQLAVGVALGHHLAVRRLTGSFRLDFALAKEIFAYSMKTQLSHAAQTTNLRLDQLAMSIFLAPSELGIYAVACAAPTLVTFGSTALATVVLPDVARRPTVVRGSTLIRYFRMNLLVLCGLAAAAVAVAPAIVPMLYGSDYRASVLPLQILCVAAVFQGTNDVLSGGLRGMNAPGLVAGSQGVSMAVTAVGLYLLLTKYGAVGAAITSLLAYGTASIFLAGALLKRIRAASSSLLPTLLDVRTLAGIFRRPRHCSPQGLSERR